MELTNERLMYDFSDTISQGRIVGTVESLNNDILNVVGNIFINDDKIDFQVYPMDSNVGCNIQGATKVNISTILDIIKTAIDSIKQQLSE